jgi:GH18 family chitinase
VNNDIYGELILVAYFEAFNWDRECLNLDVTEVKEFNEQDSDGYGNGLPYTHIHFAFAGITDDYNVDVSVVQEQFNLLKTVKGKKRILSFGGWSFSTEADTYPIFREGVSDANRQKFANNVVAFIEEHGLEGVDFDWEYPGALDIPGIPPGSEKDGANYVKFLKMVREALPDDKSLSIAIPASYWYLKGFDPLDFEPLVDYVIYMTYDLHGQWDYGSEWASPGCPKGDCLRSHVNLTETMTALSMVTKAGMPTSKVVVRTSLYGRSFKMVNPDCSGPQCKYKGPKSVAAKGRCTNTRGYIANAEIDEILATNPSARKFYDEDSASDIMIYNDTEWVAYMSDRLRGTRATQYLSWGFRGISDWAIDL